MLSQFETGEPPTKDFTINLNGCARCDGKGHEALTFFLLTRPLEIENVILTHWALCPENGEPILLRFEP